MHCLLTSAPHSTSCFYRPSGFRRMRCALPGKRIQIRASDLGVPERGDDVQWKGRLQTSTGRCQTRIPLCRHCYRVRPFRVCPLVQHPLAKCLHRHGAAWAALTSAPGLALSPSFPLSMQPSGRLQRVPQIFRSFLTDKEYACAVDRAFACFEVVLAAGKWKHHAGHTRAKEEERTVSPGS